MDSLANAPILLDDEYADVVAAIRVQGVTGVDLMYCDVDEIAHRIDQPAHKVGLFMAGYRTQLRDSIHPQTLDEADPPSNPTSFTTGDGDIDSYLGGGIPCGFLVELSGCSASGKTNLLLNLSITVQFPAEYGGLGPSVFADDIIDKGGGAVVKTMYLSTEDPLSTQRLSQIADYYRSELASAGVPELLLPDMAHIITTPMVLDDLTAQDHCLYYQLPAALSRDPTIKLVVLDSITHHIRAELPVRQRDHYVVQTCTHLKRLAMRYGVTVIIANQVTDKPIEGILTPRNETLLKMNFDYQAGWLAGWHEVGIVYRQLLRRHEHTQWEQGDDMDLERNTGYLEAEEGPSDESQPDAANTSISEILRRENKTLYETADQEKIRQIRTIPALGLTLLNQIDARIVLIKTAAPVLSEDLVDDLGKDLNLDATASEAPEGGATRRGKASVELAKNSRLANYETKRFLRVAFTPLVPPGRSRVVQFDVWSGGIRHH